MPLMAYRVFFFSLASLIVAPGGLAQTPAGSSAASVWNALSAPAMDPSKSAHAENSQIVRHRIHIPPTDGTIQFIQPANGLVFGASFHGTGRVRVEPPNPIEAQQLRLFIKQDKLELIFTDATFSFTDSLLDEVAKQVKWQPSAPANDNLYSSRQKSREDLGESSLPRLLQGVLSPDRVRTAYFLADLKVEGKHWVEFHYDALEPEQIGIGRFVDVGPVNIYDTWMSFPADGRTSADAWKDPQAKEDFLIRAYHINATVTSGADLNATTRVEIEPRLAGQSVLIFGLDSNLRVESIKDGQGSSLGFYQAAERKDRYQSY